MVEHPAGKTMIEIARTQDEEVGDGTTSVIILGIVYSSDFCKLSILALLVMVPWKKANNNDFMKTLKQRCIICRSREAVSRYKLVY